MSALRLSSFLVAVHACASLMAQQTLVVGQGMPFPDMQSAVNASAPGDTIAVRQAPQFQFVDAGCTLSHTLTIRTDPPGGPKARCTSIVANLPAGSRLHIQDFDVGDAHITGGLVTFEGVNLQPNGVLAVVLPVLVVTQSSVTFRRHRQVGTAQIDASTIAAVDSTFRSPSPFALPGPAVVLNQSVGFFSQCAIQTISPYAGSMGLRVNAGSRADLVDTALEVVPTSVGSIWPPMPTLVVNAGGVAREHRCTFTDGIVGGGTGIVGTVQPHLMLGASMAETQGLLGGSITVNFRSQPLDPVFVLATFQLDPPTLAPLVEPEQWGFAANGFVATVLFADGAGQATFGVAVPNNPSLRGAGVWLMGASGLTFPLPLSVPVGGLLL